MEYCEKYNIPREHILEILEDQKVLPMIRGKATEFIAAVVLRQTLPRNLWHVDKLNLNPQPNQYDEDISITHVRTGIRLKIEAKNAVRGSFKTGSGRTKIKVPHFRVKCHKSRSHLKRAATTNDRYLVGEFDVLVINVSNALFQGGTLGDSLELLADDKCREVLMARYGVSTEKELIRKAYDDWRFCFPKDIALADGSIPRTPPVKLDNDEHWASIGQLGKVLLDVVKDRRG